MKAIPFDAGMKNFWIVKIEHSNSRSKSRTKRKTMENPSQNLFCDETVRKVRGQGGRSKRIGSVAIYYVETVFVPTTQASDFAAGRSKKRF
ncbi:MAG: hypothetical protein RQ760_11595 [Sedimentisphaerales bacterium]|nr:hypothetical protein [Sedimentisphaerales bacterium]